MRLGLCSGAAPDATLAELVEACRRRGLAGLELRECDAHGVNPGGGWDAPPGHMPASGADPEITGYRSAAGADDAWLTRLSQTLEVPVLLEEPKDPHERLMRAGGITGAGGRVALVIRGRGMFDEARLFTEAGFELAWDADPGSGDVGAAAGRLLDRFGEHLRHVRLLGGGPEISFHQGRGVGEMMGRLALEGYRGTMILAPGESRYRLAWQAWLGRRGGWGCGSRTSDSSLVELTPIGAEGGER